MRGTADCADGRGWGRVAIGLRMGRSADPEFVVSWTRLVMKGIRPGDRVLQPAIEMPQHYAAESLARAFIQTECDSILYVDDDMTFDLDALARLRDDEEGQGYDILQALCLSRAAPHRPIIFMPHGDRQFAIPSEAPADTIVDVGLVGLGFTLIRRHAFECVAAELEPRQMFFRWSDVGHGEDAQFCFTAREAGCRLGVSTRVQIGHRIPVVATWDPEQGARVYEQG